MDINTIGNKVINDNAFISIPTKPIYSPRKKQYLALINYKYKNSNWKVRDKIELTNKEAYPLIAANIISPLMTSLKAGVTPNSKKKDIVSKIKNATGLEKESTSKSSKKNTKSKKKFLENKLRTIVQEKKAENKPQSRSKTPAEITQEEKIKQLKESLKNQ